MLNYKVTCRRQDKKLADNTLDTSSITTLTGEDDAIEKSFRINSKLQAMIDNPKMKDSLAVAQKTAKVFDQLGLSKFGGLSPLCTVTRNETAD